MPQNLRRPKSFPCAAPSATRRLSRLAAALLLPIVLSACAPDAWKANPNFSAFVNQVDRVCGKLNIGEPTVSELLNNSAIFLDMTSRWDLGKISTADYIQSVMSNGGGRESAGLKCILAQKTQ